MLPVRNILAPTDFSDHARPAVQAACELARHFGAALHLFHVLPDVVPVGPDPTLMSVVPPEYYSETESKALETLAGAIDPAWDQPPRVERGVSWGDPISGILEYAGGHSIDLIVISTHGRTGLSHVLLGSVAERIVREAPCPVLTFRCRP